MASVLKRTARALRNAFVERLPQMVVAAVNVAAVVPSWARALTVQTSPDLAVILKISTLLDVSSNVRSNQSPPVGAGKSPPLPVSNVMDVIVPVVAILAPRKQRA